MLREVSDLVEIAVLKTLEYGIEIFGAYDAEYSRTEFLNKPV